MSFGGSWGSVDSPTLLADARLIALDIGMARGGLGQVIHPRAALRADFGGLAQHQGKDLVARCYFGQLDVRIETDLFEVRDPICRKGVVQILGNRIGVERRLAIDYLWGPKLRAPGHVTNSVKETRRKLALLGLLPDDPSRFRIEEIVHVGK